MTSQFLRANLGFRLDLGSNSRFRPGAPVLRYQSRRLKAIQPSARTASTNELHFLGSIGSGEQSSEVELRPSRLSPGLLKPANVWQTANQWICRADSGVKRTSTSYPGGYMLA